MENSRVILWVNPIIPSRSAQFQLLLATSMSCLSVILFFLLPGLLPHQIVSFSASQESSASKYLFHVLMAYLSSISSTPFVSVINFKWHTLSFFIYFKTIKSSLDHNLVVTDYETVVSVLQTSVLKIVVKSTAETYTKQSWTTVLQPGKAKFSYLKEMLFVVLK